MRQPICPLDEVIINQMAAGEVIEHPASVVKELVENSLDAGATEIRIDLQTGGRGLIRITDDGDGIPFEELSLAFLRHATSKLRTIEDLQRLGTLGFRGEALASIASVAKVSLLSSTDGKEGGLYQIEGGKEKKKEKSHREKGTTFEVEELFYNVPVRKKFLGAPDRLTSEVVRVIRGLSLAHPEAAFILTSDQKPLLRLLKTQEGFFLNRLKERLGQLNPEKLQEEWISINVEDKDLSLQGWLLGPAHHRPNRVEETLIVNRRVVDPYLISLAIREGYGPSLPDHRHPLFLLHLNLPGELLDVNVHPQKKEIRLREKSRLHQFISRGIERALYPLDQPIETKNSFKTESVFSSPPLQFKWQPKDFLPSEILQEELEIEREASFFPSKIRPKILHRLKGFLIFDPVSLSALLEKEVEGLAILSLKRGYEKLLSENKTSLEKQTLLIPPLLTLTHSEEEALEALRDALNSIGYEVEYFGGKGYIVRAIPSGSEEREAVELLRSILRGERGKNLVKEPLYNRLLSVEEGEELLLALAALPRPSLGRDQQPLIKHLTPTDLLH